jgi:hypothetical protein
MERKLLQIAVAFALLWRWHGHAVRLSQRAAVT